MGNKTSGVDPEIVNSIGLGLREALSLGAQIAIVVGGGNIYRGLNSDKDGIVEETGHYIGMLATCINCLFLSDLLANMGIKNQVLSALGQIGKTEQYSIALGKKALDEGKVLLLAGGTGKPFCSTDTAAARRAQELNFDVILKMTKVDGVYDADPFLNKNAQKYTNLSFDEALEKGLKVMDREAFSICLDNNIPIIVAKMEYQNIKRAILGKSVGTIIQ